MRRDSDEGAVLVEFTLISTFVLLLLFGIVEFGFAWSDRLTVQTAARSGVRSGSSLGDDRSADYNVLQGVKSAIDDVGVNNVEYVIIFKSTTADGRVPPACLNPTPTSTPNQCNVYTGAQLDTLTAADFPGVTCAPAHPDAAWCPTSRETRQSVGPDYLGVYLRVRHDQLTSLFGDTITITDRSIMRLEPQP